MLHIISLFFVAFSFTVTEYLLCMVFKHVFMTVATWDSCPYTPPPQREASPWAALRVSPVIEEPPVCVK